MNLDSLELITQKFKLFHGHSYKTPRAREYIKLNKKTSISHSAKEKWKENAIEVTHEPRHI